MDTLKQLLQNGKTQFHVVKECQNILSDKGYKLVALDSLDKLPCGRYMVSPYPSMLVAFSVGQEDGDIRIACAHTDFPMLKIKPNPDIINKGYCELNVEPYGGLIKESWFDRPLGIAGRISLSGDNPFLPRVLLFDSEKPVCIIPSLAPHMRGGTKSSEMDVQKELIPILCTHNNAIFSDKAVLMTYISDKINVNPENILDYDLYLYNCDNPTTVGINSEFITSPRIDNLSSVSAIIKGLSSEHIPAGYRIGAFFDNEEIGSRSKQGADSLLLRDIIEKITGNKSSLYSATLLSVDVAHGTHPNYAEKSDVTNTITLGDGVVLKCSASQRYVTDSEAGAIVVALCREKNIKLVKGVNRSGSIGGQTLGPIISSYIPAKAVDIGIPMLAMHSASELISSSDYIELCRLITEFFRYAN